MIMLAPSIQPAFAHFYPNDVTVITPEIALDFCEFFYEEYLLLGPYALQLQHPLFPRIRSCIDLYQHIVWNLDHPDRDRILIAEIEKKLGNSEHVKERHNEDFDSIPTWIQTDAKMWVMGEIRKAQYAYGVKALINADVIVPKALDMSDIRNCDYATMCVLDGDYLMYSITDNFEKDIVTIKHTFSEESPTKFKVIEEKISKDGKEISEFYLNPLTGLTDKLTEEDTCCVAYSFWHTTPIISDTVFSSDKQLRITEYETTHTFKELYRDSFIATDQFETYVETIDKETGIILTAKQNDYDIIPLWEKTELIDTNIFFRERGIQLAELEIPNWWKDNVMWYLDGIISETEYLKAMEYLVENRVIKV